MTAPAIGKPTPISGAGPPRVPLTRWASAGSIVPNRKAAKPPSATAHNRQTRNDATERNIALPSLPCFKLALRCAHRAIRRIRHREHISTPLFAPSQDRRRPRIPASTARSARIPRLPNRTALRGCGSVATISANYGERASHALTRHLLFHCPTRNDWLSAVYAHLANTEDTCSRGQSKLSNQSTPCAVACSIDAALSGVGYRLGV
jgi:hypothetical protein